MQLTRRVISRGLARWVSSGQQPMRGGVKYERAESTKLVEGDVLCPDNVKLVEVLGRYAELQRARGNVDLYDAYTTPAAGILDNVRKFAGPITNAEGAKSLRLRFIPSNARTDFRDRLEELQVHGDIAELHEDPAVTSRKLFQQIPGLTHLADDFVLKGYRTLEDLKNSPEAAKWSTQQLREVIYFEDLASRIQTQESVLMGMLIKDHLSDWNRDVLLAETGSSRRREIWAREQEMRFLLSHPDVPEPEQEKFFKDIVAHLTGSINGGEDWEVWADGGTSVILKARIPPVYSKTRWRKVSLIWVPHSEWVPQLINHTGHHKFIERLGDRAREKGWKLLREAIYTPSGELAKFATEEEFFNALEEPFVPPFDRTEQGPQLNRRNNDFTFVAGEYKEKPRAHRVRNHKGRRPTYHELLRRREVMNTKVDKDFGFGTTNFENGFNKNTLNKRVV